MTRSASSSLRTRRRSSMLVKDGEPLLLITLASMGKRPRTEWSSEWTSKAEKLTREVTLLEGLLPQTWPEEQIAAFIRDKGIDVTSQKSDGQAMGAVMQELKKAAAPVDSARVKNAVEALRRKG